MDFDVLDFDQICRTCKCAKPQMRSVFEGYENSYQSPRINDMLIACASVQVMCGDGLPSQICQTCVEQLKNAFDFKHQCENVDTSLREYAKNAKSNKIKEELETEPLNMLKNLSSLKEKEDNTQTVITPKIETDYIQLDNIEMLLPCRECAKIFTTVEGLQYHKCILTENIFKCNKCNEEYTRLDHLRRHELSHNRKQVYVCRICNKFFNKMESFKEHLMTHLRQRPFSCKACNRGFYRIDHLRIHTPRCKGDTVLHCDFCNKMFKREDSLEVHKKMHDNELPKLSRIDNLDNIEDHYYMMDLDQPFSDHSDVDDCFQYQGDFTESMDNDKIKVMTDEQNNVKEEKLVNFESECDRYEDNNEGSSYLDDCFKHQVQKTESMEVTEVAHHVNALRGNGDYENNERINNDSSEEKEANENLQIEETVEDEDEYYEGSSYLDEYFEHQLQKTESMEVTEVAHHVNALRGNGDYENNERINNDSSEEQEANENLQMEVKVEDEDEYYEVTDEDSGDSTDSEYQPGNVSPKVKRGRGRARKNPPKVRVAGRARARPPKEAKKEDDGDDCDDIKKSLNEKSKKFACTECGQRFIRNDYLIVHMRRHRGEKPFKCKYCGKGFPRPSDLVVHERYHTGEKTHMCIVCGRGFVRLYNLKVHMRIHTGEKPYKCTYCDAAFAQGNDLKAHIRGHTGEKFQCDLCTSSYLVAYKLAQHKRASHGINVVSNKERLDPVLKTEQSR